MDKNQILEKVGWRIKVEPYLQYGISPHGIILSMIDDLFFKEIERGLGKPVPASGDLTRWAQQGVLLLNATLTVQNHRAGSHQGKGWETFTDAAIRVLAAEKENLVFMLWGNYAQQKGAFIDSTKHLVLKSVHPSPLSAYRGFIGNNHFALANNYLKEHGKKEIEW